MKPNWIELDRAHYDVVWDRFYDEFRFRPSSYPDSWPSFKEPGESATYSIAHLWADEDLYESLKRDAESKILASFKALTAPTDWLFALDWQHPGHRFFPHVPFEANNSGDWPVPLLPDGDYYIFLDPEFRFGTFGHPWEQTFCVFGRELLSLVVADPPALFNRVVRIDGKPA